VECKPFVLDLETMALNSDMLQAFLKVAERGSVSAAAAALGVGKSAVSKRIALLEGELGSTLFARSTRRVVLTPGGQAYLAHARRALAEMEAGAERLKALRSELVGAVRVSATVSWGQRVLSRVLPAFLRDHPGIELELHLDDRMVDLAYDDTDLALRWSPHAPQGLVSVPLARVDWYLVAAPSYLAQAGAPQAPDDLARHSCLAYWREAADELWALAPAGRDDVEPNPTHKVRVHGRYHADHPEVVTEAALAGLGIALLPDYLCADAVADGRLRPVLPAWTPCTRFGTQITAVATPERMGIVRNRMLLGFLQEQLARPSAASTR
jgi:DNA-binding transcriptional LysR family regulator